MIFALVILAVAAMILAGTVMVSGAMVEQTIAAQTAANRRIALENSRSLAVQYVREKVLTGERLVALADTTVTDGGHTLGRLSVPAATPWTSTTRATGPNPFSPAGDTLSGSDYYSGYTSSVAATLYSGATSVAWTLEIRTRTPTLGYDQLNYVSTSGTVSSGSVGVPSASAIGTVNGPVGGGALLNCAVPPDIPAPNFVTNAKAAAVVTIDPMTSSGTSPYFRSGSGSVTVFVNGPNETSTLLISGSLTSLNFNYGAVAGNIGTTSGYPLRIVFDAVTTPSAITLDGGALNGRPIYLVCNSSRRVTITPTGSPRLNALFLNTPLTIGAGSITGGIRTNEAITVTGALSILRETAPGALDSVALRRGWVENYRP